MGDGIKLYPKEMEWKVVDWINLETLRRDNWWAVVSTVTNLLVP
jgi:hypothetical protein